jgi:UDP-N-acetylglucosamine 2-epimerase (non-hydrolysing)
VIIFGTRPEIIKLYPVIRHLRIHNQLFTLIHTNQHYSVELDEIFFKELNIPIPEYNLLVGSHSHGKQTGLMLHKIEKILLKERPEYVIVQGDTNSTLAGALAAVKIGIKVIHIEAGLRSYDMRMPEEVNRLMVDHISDILFTPTDIQKQILIHEGINESKIHTVGNTIVDSINHNLTISNDKSSILGEFQLQPKNYFLLTLHRPSNVDDKSNLLIIFNGLERVIETFNHIVVFPIHPRTLNKIKEFEIELHPQIKIINPVGYLDMLKLIKFSKLVFTDSGGIQEESCILNIPTLTIRDNTERTETIHLGANIIVGTDSEKMLEGVEHFQNDKNNWVHPYGDNVAEKIITLVEENNVD